MSDNKQEDILVPSSEVLVNLDELENRLAQGYSNLAESLSMVLNQYSTQAQIVFELAREPYGFEISEPAKQYKDLMARETARIEAETAAAVKAAE